MGSDTVPLIIPFFAYIVGIASVIGLMYGLSYILGERHEGPETARPYESGIEITGSARVRYHAQFYLIAILFLLFDLEVIFLFAWSIAAKIAGVPGYIGMLIFSAMIVIGLVYEWRMGAIDQLRRYAGYRPGGKGERP